MAVTAGTLRPLAAAGARTRRRQLLDRWAARLVVVGGLVVIGSILAILAVIVAEVAPLFRDPTATRLAEAARLPAGRVLAGSVGVDEYREVLHVVTGEGVLHFVGLSGAEVPAPVPVPGLGDAHVTAIAPLGGGRYAVGTSDGRVSPAAIELAAEFEDGRRRVRPKAEFGEPAALDPGQRRPIRALAGAMLESGPVIVARVGPGALVLQRVVERKALIGPGTRETTVEPVAVEGDGEITAVAVDGRGDDLFVGTASGQLVRFSLREGPATRAEAVKIGAAVTALGFLIGDRTLVVGDAAGGVSTWQVIPPPAGGPLRLTRMHAFEPHRAPVVAMSPSRRDKGFVTGDADGVLRLHHGTSGQTLLALPGALPGLVAIAFAPRGDGVVAVDAGGPVAHWAVRNPHPETTLRTLFGEVWYEGYPEPAHVWQSTGGTDDFEAKLSLTPLLYGTLKGTFYALLIAAPLALLAALYVSEFMHASVKAWVKPVVEIMAALPSVVLGFLAGLWLAPVLERIVPGVFLFPVVVTVSILVAASFWRLTPLRLRGRVRAGMEVFLLIPVVLVAAWLAFSLGGLLEGRLLGGDYRQWLLSALGLGFDQRNSLVVGVAMGFAVIPIIFTIAEDSLANVPQHLRAGSLALGASRWQTAVRVVLPTASPGIFSAVMIGFGRAVGETMIVLMATGNTPVMDWSIFSGFRALSANIAVELPEAPEGGTLFRVLFLAAFLLFCLTFAVNTVAEVVRLKLRQRYRYL